MSIADPPRKSMTAEELMAMPDDGIDRWIIRGELIERPGEAIGVDHRGRPMTVRNHAHSEVEALVAASLVFWQRTQPRPRGKVHSGEAGFRLQRDPESVVGIDVAYVSAEQVAAKDPKTAYYDGPPVLAVEILSPSDQHGDVMDKVDLYLEAGSIVWVIDPRSRNVDVHRSARPVETFNETHELSGDPELPGFRVKVTDLFS